MEGSMSENKKNCSKTHVSLYYIIGKYLAIIGINILEPATLLFVLYISLRTSMAFWIKSW